MNGAYLHLAVNHIPVVGVPICFLLLAGGIVRKSRDLIQAGLIGLVLMAIVTAVAFQSGGPAVRVLFESGAQVERPRIFAHAHEANEVYRAAVILGIVALIAFIMSLRDKGVPKLLTYLILLGSLGVSCWFGYVAHLGGLIRHPEIESLPTPPTPPGKPESGPAAVPSAGAPQK